tara:strand:- start:112 stop:525 length:414 start_codon:yes stop_codon:yes gene_type:complete
MGIGKWLKKRKMKKEVQKWTEFYDACLEIKKIIDRKKKLVDDGVLIDLTFDTLMMERIKINEYDKKGVLELLGTQNFYKEEMPDEITLKDSLTTIVSNQELDKELIIGTYNYMIGCIQGGERILKEIKQELKELLNK